MSRLVKGKRVYLFFGVVKYRRVFLDLGEQLFVGFKRTPLVWIVHCLIKRHRQNFSVGKDVGVTVRQLNVLIPTVICSDVVFGRLHLSFIKYKIKSLLSIITVCIVDKNYTVVTVLLRSCDERSFRRRI